MPMKFVLLFCLMVSSAFATDWKELHLTNGCRIYTMTGKQLRSFPGFMCLFFDNGNFISASETHIRLINKNSEVVWEVPGSFHHQMNLSNDGQRIMTLDSVIVETPKGKMRADVPTIISLDGKVLYRVSAEEIMKQTKQLSLDFYLNPELVRKFGVHQEISHFNSIYEIPKITARNVPAYIKEGNIIVNGLSLGIHILSPDMKTVLHQTRFPSSDYHWVHDVKVKENGNYLFYNNMDAEPSRNRGAFPTTKLLSGSTIENYSSSVQEITPALKNVFTFNASPKSMFFSRICGNVQEIDQDMMLFTHNLNGTFIYSKKQKTIVATIPGTHADGERIIASQEVWARPLSQFLSHW